MIPMVNLKREYRKLKVQIDQALLEEARFILGPNVTALEQEVAALHNTPDAVAVATGTDALPCGWPFSRAASAGETRS